MSRLRHWALRAGRIALLGLAGYAAWVALMLPLYLVVNPPQSNLMFADLLARQSQQHRWMPLSRISPAVVTAVLLSEDAGYCDHWGVDWAAAVDAFHHSGRGASTIPMQTVKNLFLWNGRTVLRKIPEVPLAYLANLIWGKRRLLEIYLNIAEWGPGVFGIEAAAQHHFHTSSANLTSQQATLLAASLPNPIKRNAGHPAQIVRTHAARVRAQFGAGPQAVDCVKR
jgi:monofunctional glycosyltransferase